MSIEIDVVPDSPGRLFKYQAVTEYSLRNLSNSEVYLAPKDKLNDAHELNFRLESYREYAAKERQLAVQRERYFQDSGYVESINSMLSSRREKEKYAEDSAAFLKILSGAGILSTTTERLHRLMWAHYADSNRGFCLEFDSNFLDGKGVALHPADYLDNPPILSIAELRDFQYREIKNANPSFTLVDLHCVYLANAPHFKSDMTQHLILNAMTAKERSWSYEDEWRYVWGKHGAVKYEPSALKSVTFGSAASETTIFDVSRALEGQQLSDEFCLYQVALRTDGFGMDILEVPR